MSRLQSVRVKSNGSRKSSEKKVILTNPSSKDRETSFFRDNTETERILANWARSKSSEKNRDLNAEIQKVVHFGSKMQETFGNIDQTHESRNLYSEPQLSNEVAFIHQQRTEESTQQLFHSPLTLHKDAL